MTDTDIRCACMTPGFFCCGVPGVIAHLQDGHVAADAKVERCDQCCLYADDESARQRLNALGLMAALASQSTSYAVHCYAIVRVRLSGIQASSPQNAAREAERRFDWDEHRHQAEFAEEFSEFLVDIEGAPDFAGSRSFNSDFEANEV